MSSGYTCGPRIICPAERDILHGELLHTFRQYAELTEKIKGYEEIIHYATGIDPNAIQRMTENLHIQETLLEFKIKKLRDEISGKYDDIQGMVHSGYVKPLYPSTSYSRPNRKFGRDETVVEWLYKHEEQKRFFEEGF